MNKQKLDLVILAGGRGTRIRNITKKIPKPLIKVNNLHFIQYLLNFYSKYNFNKIYILTGYQGGKFNKFQNIIINLIPVECIKEKKPLDTGGALNQLRKKINNNFILINGDSFVDYNFKKFLKNKLKKDEVGKILLVENKNYKSNNKLSNLKIDKSKKIFFGGHLMNAGVYFFNKKIFNYLKSKKISIENEILPKLIQQKLLKGFTTHGNFLDIGTYNNLRKAKRFFKNFINKPSILLDRDGVINIDTGHVYKIKDFIFRKNVISCLKLLNKKKINIFVITNQAGIAKGLYSEKDFLNLHRYLKTLLEKKNIYINDIEYCPYHPKAKIKKYKKNSQFRKPGNLMIEKIKKKWLFSNKNSFMIGDNYSDKLAAKKSKVYFEYVKTDILKQVKKINHKLRINNYS